MSRVAASQRVTRITDSVRSQSYGVNAKFRVVLRRNGATRLVYLAHRPNLDQEENVDTLNVGAFAPMTGGNRRTKARKIARTLRELGPRRSKRQQTMRALESRTDVEFAPGYRVVYEHNRTARLAYRAPRRKCPECEKPSRVVVTSVQS